jgi:hypothetical protein
MAAKTPLLLMKEKFGEKAKLVEAVEKFTKDEALWVARVNEDKGLAHVSNAKLLRLHATFAEVKEKFGSRAKLIDAILEVQKRSKDTGLRQKISDWPVPRLYDAYKSAAKRNAPKAAVTKSTKKEAAPTKAPAAKAKKAAATKTAKAPAAKAKKTAAKGR